jgi:hypothetical protein
LFPLIPFRHYVGIKLPQVKQICDCFFLSSFVFTPPKKLVFFILPL